MVRLGQNFLADPNLLDAIVRDAGLEPADVVLEVGPGEGVLTGRLAERARARPRGRDRSWPRGGAGRGRRAARRLPALGRRDALRFRQPRPGADGDGRQPPLLGGDAGPPAHDRGAALDLALDGDGPARDRRPPAGRPRQPHLRVAERGRPARLRGEPGAHASTRRSSGPGRGSTRRSWRCAAPARGRRRRRASWSAPPSPIAASRSPARSSTRGRAAWPPRAARARRARAARGRPGRGARARRFRRSLREAAGGHLGLRCGYTRQPSSTSVSSSGHAAATGCTSSARCSSRSPSPTRSRWWRPSATRSSARGSTARTSRPGRWRRCARRAGADRRCGSRSRSGSRSRRASVAAAPTPPPSCGWREPGDGASIRTSSGSPSGSAPTSRPSSVPSLALVRGAGEEVERLPDPEPHAVVLLPGGGGLSTADVFAEADRLGARPQRRGARRRSRSGCARRPAPAPRRSPTPSCSTTTSSPRPAPCGRRSATRSTALREAGAPLALLTGSGPTAFGLFADLGAAQAAAARLDRDDAIVCGGRQLGA